MGQRLNDRGALRRPISYRYPIHTWHNSQIGSERKERSPPGVCVVAAMMNKNSVLNQLLAVGLYPAAGEQLGMHRTPRQTESDHRRRQRENERSPKTTVQAG